MAATGTEAVQLKQLKHYADSVDEKLNGKVAKPSSEGTSGQYLQTNGDGTTTWATVSTGPTYTGTAPISVSGSTISVADAAANTKGVVTFVNDDDFMAFMGLS